MISTTHQNTRLPECRSKQLSDQGRLVFSTQVFNEFSAVMMRAGRKTAWSPGQTAMVLRELEAAGEVVPVTSRITFRALDAMPGHGLSFWDALIWEAAAEGAVTTTYTEDFQDGREIDGVRFVNSFSPDFSVSF
jgi:predicted nucleic acid-binding protein